MSLFNLQSRSLIVFSAAVVVIVVSACSKLRATYAVPDGKYLLKDNKVDVYGDNMNESDLKKVIRQQPNLKAARSVKLRLIAYNLIDSTKTEEKRLKRVQKLIEENAQIREKERKVNTRRRNRVLKHNARIEARAEGVTDTVKRKKILRKKKEKYFYRRFKINEDTLNPRLTWRERIKYKFGEAPVIVDTFLFRRSMEQLGTYMRKKGYFYSSVSGTLDTLKGGKSKKIVAHYAVTTGPRYYIDSFAIETNNSSVANAFREKFLKKEQDKYGLNGQFYRHLKKGEPIHIPYDTDVLNDYRNIVAKFMRDEAYYGYSPSHITYRADTNSQGAMTVNLRIVLGDRLVKLPGYSDSLVAVKHVETKVSGVYFHICDTAMFEGEFYKKAAEYGYEMKKLIGFVPTFDTLFYAEKLKRVENMDDGNGDVKTYYKSGVHTTMFGQPKDSIALDPFRMATFYYNGKIKKRKDGDYDTIIFAQPGLLEAQNYLEYTNYYKEYYFDRTYNRLLQLGLFSIIKPEIIEDVRTGTVEVHYYLVPAEKQSYSFEPRATNANGFLGVSASVNYANKNLFRAGWITTISLSGGFESQPPVFDETIDGNKVQTSGRSFNTFEFGPSIKFDLPGFFPVNVAKLPKRSRPRTVLSAAYNYQKRPDFSREVLQMNFLWRLYVGKTQIVSAGVPFVSVIKFVSLERTPEFEARIKSLNDLFLRNAYSDQLIWEDLKFIYDVDNKDKDNRKNDKFRWIANGTFNMAGNTLSMFRARQKQDSLGHYQAFGVNYSQFFLLDGKFIAYYAFNPRRVLAMRVLGGVGVPYGNTTTSLPYDYSFFAGGSNDNRGFVARALGPGSYKYYMDSTRTATQIGDIRFGASLEFRLGNGFLNSAFFMDVDNIWTIKKDSNRLGSQFSKDFYRELGLTFGYGIRIDFEFFIVRADLGIPFTNPALPRGARWIFQSRDPYILEINTLSQKERDKLSGPFRPRLNIGIGFPF